MMISEASYRYEHENDSYNKLLKERAQLRKEIIRYEYEKEHNLLDYSMLPSPDTIYSMNQEYLEQINELIKIREKEQQNG